MKTNFTGGLRTKNIIKQSKEDQPLISIITVVCNAEKTLEETILSVLNQTYINIEYIIVDGASNDNSLNIIKKYDDRIDYWISENDGGIYEAMNKGIDLANGEYIALLNSDDWYELNVCEIIAEKIKEVKYDVYYAIARVIDKKGNVMYLHGSTINDISHQSLAHQTCFISKNIYKHNKYSLKYRSASDYDFLCNLIIKNISFIFIEFVFVNYRLNGMSDSILCQLETIDIKKKYKYINFSYYIIHKIYLTIIYFIEKLRKNK